MSATRATQPSSQSFKVPKNALLLKSVVMLATFMQVLDMTIANVALPHMQAALGATQDNISWVLTSYIVAAAVAIPLTGWLSDKIGRRTLYLWSVGGFMIASMLCGVAANIEEMVLFRLLQGLSGAFLSPLAQAVLVDTTPPEKRGQAMAVFGMGIVIGPILGPVLGGWLTDNLDWRWVFFVNIPFGALAFAGLWLLLEDVKRPTKPFDYTGFILLAVALTALQLMLDRGERADWFNSIEIWLEAGLAASAFWMFVIHLLTGKHPIFSKELLSDSNLVISALLMSMVGFLMTTAMALLPLMLENLFGYPVMTSGMLLSSRGIGVLVMMGITGKLISHVDSRVLVITGLAIAAFSFWEMTQWSLDMPWTVIAMNGLMQGAGMGMMFVPISTVGYATLPAHERTNAASLINLTRSIGSSIGISVVVTLFTRSTTVSHADLTEHMTADKLGIDPTQLGLPGNFTDMALTIMNAEVMRQATMIGFLNAFYFMLITCICAIPFCFLFKRTSGPAVSDDPPEAIL